MYRQLCTTHTCIQWHRIPISKENALSKDILCNLSTTFFRNVCEGLKLEFSSTLKPYLSTQSKFHVRPSQMFWRHKTFEKSCTKLQLTILKSVNLQYIKLGRLDDGTNKSSTKRLMFHVIFFSWFLAKFFANILSIFFLIFL